MYSWYSYNGSWESPIYWWVKFPQPSWTNDLRKKPSCRVDFPMIFLGFSHGFSDFPWFSHGFPVTPAISCWGFAIGVAILRRSSRRSPHCRWRHWRQQRPCPGRSSERLGTSHGILMILMVEIDATYSRKWMLHGFNDGFMDLTEFDDRKWGRFNGV